MSDVINVHDNFFRESFSRKDIAASFLASYLPKEIIRDIDLSTLNIVQDTFVEKELKEHFSDILYTVSCNGSSLYLYLLFEHKSYSDRFVGLQLLRYMVKIWEQYSKQNSKSSTLPPVSPLVLYHGKETWQLSRQFHDIFHSHDPAYRRYLPSFDYMLYDISHYNDVEIRGEVLSRIVLLMLKYIKNPELDNKLSEILSLFHNVSQTKTDIEILEVILRYVVQATNRYNEKRIKTLLEDTFTGGDIMQTFIDNNIFNREWSVEWS